MSTDVPTPRLVYRGPATDEAETCEVKTADDLAAKLKDGWRLKRIEVPAQTISPEKGKK